MHRTMKPSTRRSFVRGGLLLSLTAVSPLRTLLAADVAAKKNSKKAASIAKKAKNLKTFCEDLGGSAEVVVRPGGTTVTCTNKDGTGEACTITSKGVVRCHATANNPGDQPLEPDSPFANPGDVPDVPLEPDGGGVVLTSYQGGKHHRRRHGKGRPR